MIACIDVGYERDRAVTACVTFERWTDDRPKSEIITRSASAPLPYVPGEFYQRELPFLLAALGPLDLEIAIIDGYVTLADRPGLGAHLHAALEKRVAIVGVAKHEFRGAPSIPVHRGKSARPLFVSAIGIAEGEAAEHVRSMHGAHRIPTLLKRADTLSRRPT
jgi:deoxyribonuclease V